MSTKNELSNLVKVYLDKLCVKIGPRPTGSENNKNAQAYLAKMLQGTDFELELQTFDCLDWEDSGAEILLGNQKFEVMVNPFSPACEITAPYVVLKTLAQLAEGNLDGKIAVLDDELASEPLMPKSFKFWNPERHQKIIHLLETKAPRGIVAISPKLSNTEPIFEDGDFRIPSVTAHNKDRDWILQQQGNPMTLVIRSETRPSDGANVIARKPGLASGKIVICAHMDTKPNTPGAIDNGSGVAVLLTLAHLLRETRSMDLGIELICFNGEDYYSTPGQIAYLEDQSQYFDEIRLVINVDGVGVKGARNSIAFFDCSDQFVHEVNQRKAKYQKFTQVDPWPQGDHSIFLPHGVSCVALSSEGIWELVGPVIHTPQDTLDKLDIGNIADAVLFIREIIDCVSP